MTGRADLQMFLHGAIVLLLGYLCGFPLGVGMTENWGSADVHFWRVAHSGLVVGGVWSIATGAAVRHLSLSGRSISTLAWSVCVGQLRLSPQRLCKSGCGRIRRGRRSAQLVSAQHVCASVIGVPARCRFDHRRRIPRSPRATTAEWDLTRRLTMKLTRLRRPQLIGEALATRRAAVALLPPVSTSIPLGHDAEVRPRRGARNHSGPATDSDTMSESSTDSDRGCFSAKDWDSG